MKKRGHEKEGEWAGVKGRVCREKRERIGKDNGGSLRNYHSRVEITK